MLIDGLIAISTCKQAHLPVLTTLQLCPWTNGGKSAAQTIKVLMKSGVGKHMLSQMDTGQTADQTLLVSLYTPVLN